MTSEKQDNESPTATSTAWWQTVTPQELRAAASCIDTFLTGMGVPSDDECERFARAVALQCLFEDDRALKGAADRAFELAPRIDAHPPSFAARDEAREWIPRGEAVVRGLERSIELLRPRTDAVGAASTRQFQMRLAVLKEELIEAPFHDGTGTPFPAPTPFRLRNRQV